MQVYNTLWYPSYEYDLPLFGVDLISLGKNRVMSVIDFQPLYPTEEYHARYIQQLTATINTQGGGGDQLILYFGGGRAGGGSYLG